MLDEPLITIIVPVYNAERYLSRCVDSILRSFYKNWQLILVDDGSTDGSGQICDKYAENDDRIEAYHIANAGVSNARNVGLNHAQGVYVGFVDSDDWIHEEMYSKMVQFAQINDCDMVQVNFVEKGEDDSHREIFCDTKGHIKTDHTILLEYAKGNITNNVWNKLFKHELLNRLRFDTNYSVGEDAKFIYEYCKMSGGGYS